MYGFVRFCTGMVVIYICPMCRMYAFVRPCTGTGTYSRGSTVLQAFVWVPVLCYCGFRRVRVSAIYSGAIRS